MHKKNKFLFFVFFLPLIIYWRWFVFPVFSYGDWYFNFQESISEWLQYPSIWKTQIGLGFVDFGLSGWPYFFLYSLIGRIGFDSNLADKIFFMFPLLTFCALGSFLLVKKITESTIGGLIGFVVFTFNTYFLLGRTAHLTLMTSFAFAPFVIYLFFETLEKRSFKKSVITGLIAFLSSMYEIRAFYILAAVLGLSALFFIATLEIKRIKELLYLGFLSIVPFLLVLLLNIYWILGFAFMGSLTGNSIFSRSIFGSPFLDIRNAFTLFHPFWTGSNPAVFVVQKIPFIFWLIPILAFMGLYLNSKKKYIILFGVIALLGITLTKQEGPPFSGLYSWLYLYLPGFGAFREASKFFFLIALGYSVLLGSFFTWLWKEQKASSSFRVFRFLLTTIFLFIFIVQTISIATGNIGTLNIPSRIPTDYKTFKKFIVDQPEYFRTYWVPIDTRWSIYTNNHPTVNSNLLYDNFFSKAPEVRDNNQITESEKIINQFHQKYTDNLLDLLAVKYIVVPLEDTENRDNFFVFYGKDRSFYIQELDKIAYLKKIDINTKEVVVYENSSFRPHIYLTNNMETFDSYQEYKEVSYKFITPTQYEVNIHIDKPVYLNFSESYHPDWEILIGQLERFNFLKKEYPIAADYHFKNDFKLNSFLIDPEYIKKNFHKSTYRDNMDGSITLLLTIYFKTQKLVDIGIIISLSTLVLSICYLIISSIYKNGKNI